MNCEKAPTGKPSEDRRWMQYYPEMMLKMIQKPECTLWEYLEQHCPGPDVVQSIIMEKISPGKLFSRNPKNVRDH